MELNSQVVLFCSHAEVSGRVCMLHLEIRAKADKEAFLPCPVDCHQDCYGHHTYKQ